LIRLRAGRTAPEEGLFVGMPDRRWVVYKTTLQRFIETSIVLLLALASASVWQAEIPEISPSYIVLAALLVGFAVVPVLGARIAELRGAPMMSREERTRRYLSELGPIGLRPGMVPLSSRRTRARDTRR
jgi:hypothetical protein